MLAPRRVRRTSGRGLNQRLAVVATLLALDAAALALAFQPPLGPLFVLQAVIVSLNGLAVLALAAQLTGLSPTDGAGAQNRWATEPRRDGIAREKNY